MSAEIQSVRIFIAYSSKDLEFQRELKNHLEPLVRNKRIVVMDNYAINPGDNWDEKIGQMLEQSDIVLLLLSADALASPHFFREAGIAIEQRRQGRTDIIPVKLRPCDLEDEPLLQELDLLEVLPEKDVPVVKWQHRDDAYLSIVKGLKTVLRVREDAFAALEQHTQRQREYADLTDQADALMKKKKWTEAKTLLDKALKTWEKGFEPKRELLEKQLDKCKEEIKATEAAERKKRQEAVVAADNTEWQTTGEVGTEAAYKKYLSKYPEGLHVAQAKKKIAAYEQAREEDTRRKAAEVRAREEAERKEREAEEAARKKRERETAEARAREEAEHKRREAEEAEKKNDPFADLMLPIKGGAFDMGDTFGEGYDTEKPVHRVTVKDFYLCKYPVTQAQWKAVMGDTPSHFKGDDLPVESVSWDDAQNFIKKLNKKTGKKYRLPSEAEWEYAAREGGKKVRFGNGKDIADPKEINFCAKEEYKKPYSKAGEYRQKTTPAAATFGPNALGLHDMSGNVWEWCEDVWHDNYKSAPDDGSAWITGGDQSRRVVRGGAWNDEPDNCRAASRYWDNPDGRYNYIGFRLAR